MNLAGDIKQRAYELGFDLVGITDASPIASEHVAAFQRWFNAGCSAGMDYLSRNFAKRIDPGTLLAGARSVIVVGLNYARSGEPLAAPAAAFGSVVTYAQYEDYHPFIKARLRRLAEFIRSVAGRQTRVNICVDSAPIAERALAQRAGLGFIGRNRMLINPQHGCQTLLGEIVTTLEVKPDEPVGVDCAGCDKCIRACPTGALRTDGQFDARRCISYLTIEHKGPIPPEYERMMGNHVFGCDECLLACPYQSEAPRCRNAEFRFFPELACLDLHEVLRLDEQSFASRFGLSPIKRAGLDGLKRNAEICLVNLADTT